MIPERTGAASFGGKQMCGIISGYWPERPLNNIHFSYFDYAKEYGRGEFKGVDGAQVTSVLNTIARMGVIDAKHFGGNSWHTPYGPICLHEQYIAQMGLGINDPRYLEWL